MARHGFDVVITLCRCRHCPALFTTTYSEHVARSRLHREAVRASNREKVANLRARKKGRVEPFPSRSCWECQTTRKGHREEHVRRNPAKP